MTKPLAPIPQHLRASELRRRLSILMKVASESGLEIGGVRLTPAGEITLLDKSTSPSESDEEAEWLGR